MVQRLPATVKRVLCIGEFMNPVSRYPVNKDSDADSFRRSVGKTKALNAAPPPMRGGFRL